MRHSPSASLRSERRSLTRCSCSTTSRCSSAFTSRTGGFKRPNFSFFYGTLSTTPCSATFKSVYKMSIIYARESPPFAGYGRFVDAQSQKVRSVWRAVLRSQLLVAVVPVDGRRVSFVDYRNPYDRSVVLLRRFLQVAISMIRC